MKTFLIVIVVLVGLCALSSLVHLSWEEHPRENKVSVGADAANLIIQLAVLAWAAWLLSGK